MVAVLEFLVLAATVLNVSAYKYLVYSPIFGYSQQKFMGAIADSLTAAGHDVTMLMPVQEELYRDKPGVSLTKKIIYVDADDTIKELSARTKSSTYKLFWTMAPDASALVENGKDLTSLFEYTCNYVLNSKGLMERLAAEKFDVGISEVFQLCGYGIFDILGLNKTVSAGSAAIFEHNSHFLGEPMPFSYVPAMMSTHGAEMSMLQRLENAFNGYMGRKFFEGILEQEHKMLKQYYPDIKDIEELMSSASLVLTNSNPYLDFPRPILQKTVDVGGITVHIEPAKELDEKLNNILNERNQTIYISFGSVAKSKDMPLEWKKSLLQVFQEMSDVTFIWKYEEKTDLADGIPNAHLFPWLPQNDLLADDRVSLFVTHGGLGSTTEVAYQGKPAVVIGLFAEQPRNGLMLARHGGALMVDKTDLIHPHVLVAAFRKVLNDPSYKTNAVRLANTLKNKPISNQDLVVKHSEFVAKYGPLNQLDAYGRKLSLLQYYLLDIVFVIFGLIVVVLGVILYSVRYIFRTLFSVRKTKKD